LEWRERVRLYVSLVNQRTVWCQRIHAELYQHGVAVPEGAIRTAATRAMLGDDDLMMSPAARQRITVGYRMIDATDAEAQPLKDQGERAASWGFKSVPELTQVPELSTYREQVYRASGVGRPPPVVDPATVSIPRCGGV
jgi:hypothetical protein